MHKIGVVALQGAARPHCRALEELGARAVEVRSAAELSDVDAVVLPGGESTTVSMLLDTSGLRGPLGQRAAGGMAVLATCAGVILLAGEVLDGRPDQQPLGVLDIAVRRNAYGRQVDSFEAPLDIGRLGSRPVAEADRHTVDPFPAVFIRAPVVERWGPGVEVLAAVDGSPVLLRQGAVLAATFHPELSDDLRVHAAFLEGID